MPGVRTARRARRRPTPLPTAVNLSRIGVFPRCSPDLNVLSNSSSRNRNSPNQRCTAAETVAASLARRYSCCSQPWSMNTSSGTPVPEWTLTTDSTDGHWHAAGVNEVSNRLVVSLPVRAGRIRFLTNSDAAPSVQANAVAAVPILLPSVSSVGPALADACAR